MELTDDECDRVEPSMESRDHVVREWKFLGDNMDPNISAMNGSWSMALRPNLDDTLEREILSRLESSITREVFPRADESSYIDVERVLRTNHNLPWLGDLHRYGSKGSAIGAEDNQQPIRRTVSIVLSNEYEIEDPINKMEEKRKVLDMNVHTCPEMPPDVWMSRPMTNLEYAAMMIIWKKCWPYLPKDSCRCGPNACQYCIYQRVLDKQMGKHRDNFHRPDLKLLAGQRKAKLPVKGTWAGVRNSQVKGSAVIVYSMVSRLSPGGGAYQEKTEYVVEPTFCFRFERGWICILDCIDDLLIRLSNTVAQFYSDTSKMRLTGESLKYRGKDKTSSGVSRNVYT